MFFAFFSKKENKHLSKYLFFIYRIIILKKSCHKEFQTQLEPLVIPKYLTSDTTLLLIDAGLEKKVHRYLKLLPHLKLPKDVEDTVHFITYYLEAGIEAGTTNKRFSSTLLRFYILTLENYLQYIFIPYHIC